MQVDMIIRTIERPEGPYFHAGDLADMFIAASGDIRLSVTEADQMCKLGELIQAIANKEVQ